VASRLKVLEKFVLKNLAPVIISAATWNQIVLFVLLMADVLLQKNPSRDMSQTVIF
jgi:hypothetical protein